MKKIVAFVDDSLPVVGDVILNDNDLKKSINLSDEEWKSESNLKDLIKRILNTDRYLNGEVEILGFQHPEKILGEIEEKNFNPELIIYDWEYFDFSEESGTDLIEILKKTNAFIFVYSSFFDSIYPILNKSEFDEFVTRIQLLSKGDRYSSIFSSEEFIVQYFLSLFSKNNTIQLSNHTIKFNSSGYLENSSDILYLESILGREFILNNLLTIDKEISKEKLELLFDRVYDKLFLSNDKKNIIAEDNELMVEKFGPLSELTYKAALEKIGVKGIYKLLSSGIFSIK